jgi:hypothetical protein
MAEQDIFDRLVGDPGDARDQLIGLGRGWLRIDNHDTVVADNDAGTRIALCGVGIEPRTELVERDLLLGDVFTGGKGLAGHGTVLSDIISSDI